MVAYHTGWNRQKAVARPYRRAGGRTEYQVLSIRGHGGGRHSYTTYPRRRQHHPSRTPAATTAWRLKAGDAPHLKHGLVETSAARLLLVCCCAVSRTFAFMFVFQPADLERTVVPATLLLAHSLALPMVSLLTPHCRSCYRAFTLPRCCLPAALRGAALRAAASGIARCLLATTAHRHALAVNSARPHPPGAGSLPWTVPPTLPYFRCGLAAQVLGLLVRRYLHTLAPRSTAVFALLRFRCCVVVN